MKRRDFVVSTGVAVAGGIFVRAAAVAGSPLSTGADGTERRPLSLVISSWPRLVERKYRLRVRPKAAMPVSGVTVNGSLAQATPLNGGWYELTGTVSTKAGPRSGLLVTSSEAIEVSPYIAMSDDHWGTRSFTLRVAHDSAALRNG